MSDSSRRTIVIANRTDGGVLYWLAKLYAFAALSLIALALGVGLALYVFFAVQAPPLPDFARYRDTAPVTSRMFASDGTLVADFAAERRDIASYDEIPPTLIDAFLAAEDHTFFTHGGLSLRSILRALWANVGAGDFAEGGSTITQQVAKQFIGSEKSLSRKAVEAIVARRFEARYSKETILTVYLNEIFLGSGAYGVKAAAQRYFSKELDELNPAEAATLAGLAQRPSLYSPLRSPELALSRRNQVLERMGRYGFLGAAAVDRWKRALLGLRPAQALFPHYAPYYVEHVRRQLVDAYGEDALLRDGLRIETTLDAVVAAAAAENADFAARKQDKRQGWRGPEAHLEGAARRAFVDRAIDHYGEQPLAHGRRYLGLVEKVTASGAVVRVGAHRYPLPIAQMQWAAPWSASDAENDQVIASAREALRVGDVIWVARDEIERGRFRDWKLEGPNPRWLAMQKPAPRGAAAVELRLEQTPHPQSAIFTADHDTGYVLAVVGGYDFYRSQFNRATQACRQPGSTYKPIYYSAALEIGYGYDSLFNDTPRAEIDPETGEVWIPTNLGGSFSEQVTLEYSLVFSRNVPSVDIFTHVGADRVEEWARRLGFTTEIIADKALALGASCTLLDELTRAFAIFARNGQWIDWTYVRRIVGREGSVLVDRTVPHDPMLAPSDRLDRAAALAGTTPRQAIPARAAFLTSQLLRRAIQFGFAGSLRSTELIAAGKTGTSSATMDTLFSAYTSRWITTVWMGDDTRRRPLGRDDAAYMTVVPLWARYMYEVARDHPARDIPWVVPKGVQANDRGGSKGPQAEEPMPLVYHPGPEEAQGGPEAGLPSVPPD